MTIQEQCTGWFYFVQRPKPKHSRNSSAAWGDCASGRVSSCHSHWWVYLIHVVDFCCYFTASLTDDSLVVLQCSAIENVPCVSPSIFYHSGIIGTGVIKMSFAVSLGEKNSSSGIFSQARSQSNWTFFSSQLPLGRVRRKYECGMHTQYSPNNFQLPNVFRSGTSLSIWSCCSFTYLHWTSLLGIYLPLRLM